MSKRVRMTGAAVAVLLGVGVLTGCGADLEPSDPPKAPPTAGEKVKEEPVEEAPAVEEPAAEEGTFANPYPFGTSVGNDEASVLLGAASDQTAAVAAANQFNSPPANGAFVAIPVTVQNIEAEKVTPWLDVNLKIVAADGRSWDSTIVTVDGDLTDAGDLYPGGSATGNVYFDMPLDATAGALVAVSYSWSDEVFVKLQ